MPPLPDGLWRVPGDPGGSPDATDWSSAQRFDEEHESAVSPLSTAVPFIYLKEKKSFQTSRIIPDQ